MDAIERRKLLSEVQALARDMRTLSSIVALEQSDFEILYAVDFSEMYRYLHPLSGYSTRDVPLEDAIADQLALTSLFESESYPLVLLPPYQLEFENHLATRRRRLFDVGLKALATARSALAGSVRKLRESQNYASTREAAAVLKKLSPEEFLVGAHAHECSEVIKFASEQFGTLLEMLTMEAFSKPQFIQERLDKLISGRLQPLPEPLRSLVDEKTLEAICSSHLTHVFADKLDSRRGNSYANKIDAVAASLVVEINGGKLSKNSALILITHSQVLHDELGPHLERKIKLPDGSTVNLPLLMHPGCVNTRLLHDQSSDLLSSLKESRKWVTAIESCCNLWDLVQQLDGSEMESSIQAVMTKAHKEVLPRLKTLDNLTVAFKSKPLFSEVLHTVQEETAELMRLALDIIDICSAPVVITAMLEKLESVAGSLVSGWEGIDVKQTVSDLHGAGFEPTEVWADFGVLLKSTATSLRLPPFDEDLYPYQFSRFQEHALNQSAGEIFANEPTWPAVKIGIGRHMRQILSAASQASEGEQILFLSFLTLLSEPNPFGFKEVDRLLERGQALDDERESPSLQAEFHFLRCIVLRLQTRYPEALEECNAARTHNPDDPRFLKESGVLKWRLALQSRDAGDDVTEHELRAAGLQETTAASAEVNQVCEQGFGIQVLMNLAYMLLYKYTHEPNPDMEHLRAAYRALQRINNTFPNRETWYPEVFYVRAAIHLEMLKAGLQKEVDGWSWEQIRTDLLQGELGAVSQADREAARALLRELEAMMVNAQ